MLDLDDRLSASELSLREREVLELVAHGLSAKEIAQEVGIAPRTVERHIENVRNKLRARNKTHMVTKALAFGLLRVEHGSAADGDGAAPGDDPPAHTPMIAVND